MWHKAAAAAAGLAVAAAAVVAIAGAAAADAPQAANGGNFPHMDHVFVIMMENQTAAEMLDPSNANTAYIRSLAQQYGLARDYYGVTHPSLPNYVAAISGSNWDSNSDDPAQRFDHQNLVDQLEAHGVSWKGYMESMPSAGYSGEFGGYTASPAAPSNALYVLKHNPFMLFNDIANNPARAANVVPLDQLTTDLASGHAPDFAWISPNVCNDMHGMSGPACPYSDPAQIEQDGNQFVQHWVTAIMQSKAWTGNSAIFITWDENDYSSSTGCCDSPLVPSPQINTATGDGGDVVGASVYGGGNVPMIVVARHGVRGYSNATPYNHYSLLRTIEQNWDLGYLENAGDTNQVDSLRAFLVPNRQ